MITAILLAGGKGKRMHSRLPKVLHEIAGYPLLYYSLKLLSKLPIYDIQVSLGYKQSLTLRDKQSLTLRDKQSLILANARIKKDTVKSVALDIGKELNIAKKLNFVVQYKRLGTGHAVRTTLKYIDPSIEDILVLYGDDSFLYKPETIKRVLSLHDKSQADLTFITLRVDDPGGMGRIVHDAEGKVVRIIEEKAATEAQKKTREVNDGCYVFRTSWIREFIKQIPLSATGEYYLTDLVEIGAKNGAKIETYTLADTREWFGVNTREQLAQANQIMKLSRKIK